MKRHILDCTLRDGGYVNNWEFDAAAAGRIMDHLYQSGVRCIEIGIMGKGGQKGKSTKFASFDDMEPLLKNKKNDCRYAVMLTQADAHLFDIPVRSPYTVDIIRIAFFPKEWKEALKNGAQLIQKGYEVFLQPMATFLYTESELEILLQQVNRIMPKAVYLVDSFSNLYPKDIRTMTDHMLACLDESIDFGFHAHNNIQMAFANVMEFFDTETIRDLYADGSIFGMGRGAGNVPVELIMEYLNRNGDAYKIQPVLLAYQEELKPVYQKYPWGYDHSYYLSASKGMNSVYSWYFMNHGIRDILKLDGLLDCIKEEDKYTLVRNQADKILDAVRKE